MINKRLIVLINLGAIFLGFMFALLNIFHYAGEPTLGADIVSRVLPAEAHRIGLGVPYKNFWEITPPGHYIVLDVWSQFFGFSALSIKILHLMVAFLLVVVIFYIFSCFLYGFYLAASASVVYFFLFSTRLTTFILPAEILGLLFSVLGFASLFYFRGYKRALFSASLLFFFSSQVKDPYLFSILAIVPYILFLLLENKKKFYTGLVYAFLGVLVAFLINIGYLLAIGSFNDYLVVLNYKSVAFSVFDFTWLFDNFFIHVDFVKDVLFYFGYSLTLPILIYVSVKIYIKHKNKSLILNVSGRKGKKFIQGNLSWRLQDYSVCVAMFYILGLLVGFVIQRSLGSHYYIVAVLPLVFLIALCLNYADREILGLKNSIWWRLVLFSIFIVLLIPNKAYFSDYQFNRIPDLRFLPKLAIWANNNPKPSILAKIDTLTTKNDCILDVYGWGVGTTYLYSERGPCTRFFISNIVNQDWQRQEYKSNILKNNPKAIIYNPTSGDLDYKHFEDTVVNFSKILKHCYVSDSEYNTLYLPKYSNDKLSQCLVDNIQ